MKIYKCIGDVRGWCGVNHRSLKQAIKCIENDQRGCKKTGGYSDRWIITFCCGERMIFDPENDLFFCKQCKETEET